jgi:hypothetical protein
VSFHDCVFDNSGRAWATDVATSSAAMANSAFVIFACASASVFCSTKNSLHSTPGLGARARLYRRRGEGEDGMNNIMNARPGERAIAQRCIESLGRPGENLGAFRFHIMELGVDMGCGTWFDINACEH